MVLFTSYVGIKKIRRAKLFKLFIKNSKQMCFVSKYCKFALF